jgi:Fe-Mn family superoxide dismutase
METFIPKTFELGSLVGISSKNIEEHLKLYKGYVTNTNLIINKINEYSSDVEKNSYIISELGRRFSFEFDGMRNHEYYFSSLEKGERSLSETSILREAITKEWGSFEIFISKFKTTAMTRGIGWSMLYYDKQSNHLLIQWVDEHHLGQLTGLSPILCLDMWEHAFVYDYPTSEKKKYVEAFFSNLNWEVIENNYKLLITDY